MASKNVIIMVVGLMLAAFNVAVVGTVATGAVDGAVQSAFQTYTKDSICANDDCTEQNEDWLVSTSERSYYAWNLTNAAEVSVNPTITPIFEQVGPVEYEITAERVLEEYDGEEGTITYSEVKTFTWAGGADSTTEVTNLNILFEPQRIGATSTFIDVVASMTKAGFSAGMIENDMEVGVPSQRTANTLSSQLTDMATTYGSEEFGSQLMAAQAYTTWNNTAEAQAAYNNTFEGEDENITADTWSDPDFSAGLEYAFRSASDPGDSTISISLDSHWGPALFMGLGEPTSSITEMMSNPENSASLKRSTLFGYYTTDNTSNPDFAEIFSRDNAMYALVGSTFAAAGGGDDDWADDMDEVEDRFFEVSGARIGNHDVLNDLLWGMDGDTPRGLLVSDSAGMMWGLAFLLSTAQENPFAIMVDYGIGITDVAKIGEYAGNWFLGETDFPMILAGVSGTLNADEYLYTQFAGPDPLTGGFSTASLNVGGIWGSGAMAAYGATGDVILTNAQVENILYGPMGITTDNAVGFLYGEVTGHTLPVDPDTMLPMVNGSELTWDTAMVSQMYGIDENAAAALSYFLYQLMFNTQIPGLLEGMFGEEATGFPGATKWVTHTVDQWLFGWRDPLMASIDGDQNNLTFGWQSLETNKTYYGSVSEWAPNGVSTGDGTQYTVCTGENSDCDTGETLKQDGSEYLFWRTPEMEEGTQGMIGAESLAGTTGGFLTGEGDLVNLGDYAICSPLQMEDSDHLGLLTETWTCHLDGNERLIQAKLTNSHSALDYFPGAIPIYFGADVEMKVQPTARIIVAGASESYFYIDMRMMHEQAASEPQMSDMQPVFKIESGGGADAETVALMQDGIVANQQQFTYWTNFDTDGSAFFIDQVTASIYAIAMILILVGAAGFARVGVTAEEYIPEESEESADDSSEADSDEDKGRDSEPTDDELLNQSGGAF